MRKRTVVITFGFRQDYLPTKRHKKPRSRKMVSVCDCEVTELETENEFPLAFVVRDWTSIYHGAKTYDDIIRRQDSEFSIVSQEIRAYNGKLWMARRVSYGAAISDYYCPVDDIFQGLRNMGRNTCHEMYADAPYVEGKSVVVGDDREEKEEGLRKQAASHIIFDGKIWDECPEPRYVVNTFGLGHNHGGTSMFIEYHYNPNISKERYFNALQRDEAIEYGRRIAAKRGDTNDVMEIGHGLEIKVYKPELVRVNPKEQHGDGDPFLNKLYGITEAAKDTAEAGILAIAATLAEIA